VFPMTKQGLKKVKSRALRNRTWYKTLTRVERAIIDLTIKCVEKVRSHVLAQTVSMIISKILRTLKEDFIVEAEKVGREIAERLCRIAERWGSKTASGWKHDFSFVRFLGVNAVNTQGTYN
jgi:5-carboxymethyl-2-hydroxymuconate isomerase